MFEVHVSSKALEEVIRKSLWEAFGETAKRSHQWTERRTGAIDHFTAIHRESDNVVLGHISGPKSHDIQFRVENLDGDGTIRLTEFGPKPADDLELVKHDLLRLAKEIPKRENSTGGGNKNKRGPYLVSRPPGPTGLDNLNALVRAGIISKSFAKHCKQWGLTIHWHARQLAIA
jgi:hypothetical protein